MLTRKAFTLIELLIVVGIVAVLIALLLPAVRRAREQAQQVDCAGNLRQMGEAMHQYVTEWEYYPGCQVVGEAGGYAVWPTRLRHYMNGNQDIFSCPAHDGARWAYTPTAGVPVATAAQLGYGYRVGEMLLAVRTVPFSYAYNDWGAVDAGRRQPDAVGQQEGLGGDLPGHVGVKGTGAVTPGELPAARVRNPANMIAITDRDFTGNFDFDISPTEPPQYPGKTHRGGCNVLFADGHVGWYGLNDLILPSGRPTNPHERTIAQMWNNDGTDAN